MARSREGLWQAPEIAIGAGIGLNYLQPVTSVLLLEGAHQLRQSWRLYEEYAVELHNGNLAPFAHVELEANVVQAILVIEATMHVHLVHHLAARAHNLLYQSAALLTLLGLLRSARLHVQVALGIRVVFNTNAPQARQLETHLHAALADFQLRQAPQAFAVAVLHAAHQLQGEAHGRHHQGRRWHGAIRLVQIVQEEMHIVNLGELQKLLLTTQTVFNSQLDIGDAINGNFIKYNLFS